MSEDFDKDQHELLDAWVTAPISTHSDHDDFRQPIGARPLDIAIALRGNLPKPAFAWPAQYVKKLAPEGGSALVSLVDGMLKVMYFPGSNEADSAHMQPEDSINTDLLSDQADSVAGIIEFLANNVQNLVIIPDYRESYSSIIAHELPLLLFTAADSFAIEAAYTLLTRPVDSAKARDLPMPRVDLVFFGSPAYEAEIAAGNIIDAARACMDIDVAWHGFALRRMDPHELYEDVDVHVGSSFGVAEFIDAVKRHRGADEMFTSTSERVEQLKQSRKPDQTDAGGLEKPADKRYPEHDPVEIEPAGSMSTDDRGETVAEEPRVTITKDERAMLNEFSEFPGEPASGAPVEPKPQAAEPDRGRLLQLFPHLRPVTQHIPIDPAIECGLDQANRLHLLASEQGLRELRSAALEIKRWEDMVVGSLKLPSLDEGGLQLDLVVTDPASSSDLHGMGINLYWIDGTGRVVALNNERTARGH